MIACCLERLCTIRLILTPLQLINIQPFAYVCIFHLKFLVRCWCGQLSSLSKEMFSLRNTFSSFGSACFHSFESKHIWPWTSEVIDVGGKGEQELERKCVSYIKILICPGVAFRKPLTSALSKLEIVMM